MKIKSLFLIICLTLVASALTACGGKSANNGNTPTNKPTQTSNIVSPTAPLGAANPAIKGSPTALVTLEEFADYQCPTCAAMHPKMNEVYAKYGNQIKFVFRNFPLKIPAHDKAYDAAVATEAAAIQGKFWEMHNLLFMNQKTWSTSTDFRKVLEEYAKQIGLNVDQFTTDMAGIATKARVDADLQRGNAIGIKSTPTLILNGRILAFEETDNINNLIDAELAKAKSQTNAQTANSTSNANSANKSNTANTEKK